MDGHTLLCMAPFAATCDATHGAMHGHAWPRMAPRMATDGGRHGWPRVSFAWISVDETSIVGFPTGGHAWPRMATHGHA